MTFKYKKQLIIGLLIIVLCGASVGLTYLAFGKKTTAATAVKVNMDEIIIEPTTKYYDPVSVPIYDGDPIIDSFNTNDESEFLESAYVSKIPYATPPEILDDGSIVWDGLTVTELTNRLNKSLKSYVTNTGYFFAKYTKTYGLDPYLAVSILLLETGCGGHNGCSKLAVNCNNFGGLTGGSQKCKAGGRFNKYNTIEDGLNAFMNILYNRYYSKGKTTPQEIAFEYSNGSETWAGQVQGFYNSVKNK